MVFFSPIFVHAENINKTNVLIFVIDEDVFTKSMNQTLISLDGIVIGKFQLSNHEPIDADGLQSKDSSTLSLFDQLLITTTISATIVAAIGVFLSCLLYTSPSPRD